MKNILIIYHGAKIALKKVNLWKDALQVIDCIVEVKMTEKSGDALDFARSTKYDLTIAIGGDGTVNEVVNGLMEAESHSAFTFVPIGTGNDFNRSLKGMRSPKELVDAILQNSFRRIDLFKLSSSLIERYCCNITDVGLGGLVVKHVEEYRYKKKRHAYFKAIIKSFKKYKSCKIDLTIDGQTKSYHPLLIAFANGNYFGNGIGIAPDASIDNGLINLTIIDQVSVLTYLKFLPKLKKLKKIQDDRITYTSGKKIVINAGSLLYEVDGEGIDFGMNQSVDIRLISNALIVLERKNG
jgi:YegS/Rv2252/BmrU family lipid kinase